MASILTMKTLDILGPSQATCHALHVKLGTRKPVRVITTVGAATGAMGALICVYCTADGGLHWPGCPMEFDNVALAKLNGRRK